MSQPELQDPPPPLWALVHEPNDSYLCLWQGEDKKKICGSRINTFNNLLDHLTSEHGLHLKNCIDFCQKCECIFESAMEGLEHYIVHAITFEGNTLVRESGSVDSETETWLANIYAKIKEIRKEVLDRLLFKFLEDGTI